MQGQTEHPDVDQWRQLVGEWTTEATYPGLGDTLVTGRTSFEWLDDQQVLLQRSHSDHPRIPDAITVTAVIDGIPSMHYFDVRGVHRVFAAEIAAGTWRFHNDTPGFAQRFTGTINADGSRIDGLGELSRDDGATWERDLAVAYRRLR